MFRLPWILPLAQWKVVPDTWMAPRQGKMVCRVTAPLSRAAEAVMILNTDPGS